jgi:deoxycytidylate deaminase
MDDNRIEYLKQRAATILKEKADDRHRICAFALYKGKIVAVGFNSYVKTHPQQAFFARMVGQHRKEYLHAEVAALLRAPRHADSLLVVRINKKGEYVSAKPCPICDFAIRYFNPELKVYHT